jgi:hypothetical protein
MRGMEGSVRGKSPLQSHQTEDGRWTAHSDPGGVSQGVVGIGSWQQTGPFGSADISRRSTDQPDIPPPFQLEPILIPTVVLSTWFRPSRSDHGMPCLYTSTKGRGGDTGPRKDFGVGSLGESAFAHHFLALLLPFQSSNQHLWVLVLGKRKAGGRRTSGDKPRRRHDMRLSFKKDGLPVPCRAPSHLLARLARRQYLFCLFLACDVGTWWPPPLGRVRRAPG